MRRDTVKAPPKGIEQELIGYLDIVEPKEYTSSDGETASWQTRWRLHPGRYAVMMGRGYIVCYAEGTRVWKNDAPLWGGVPFGNKPQGEKHPEVGSTGRVRVLYSGEPDTFIAYWLRFEAGDFDQWAAGANTSLGRVTILPGRFSVTRSRSFHNSVPCNFQGIELPREGQYSTRKWARVHSYRSYWYESQKATRLRFLPATTGGA